MPPSSATDLFVASHNISAVVHALHDIVEHPQSGRAAWFAAVYLHMTRAVEQGIQQGVFKDAARMERLDVVFANRYLEAYDRYRRKQPIARCWQLAFDSGHKSSFIVLQHLLLGMNAHINYDLSIAAANISTPQNIASLSGDFELINTIIARLAGSIQDKLTTIWRPMRMLTHLTKGREAVVLNFSVDKARQASWTNAVALVNLPAGARQSFIKSLDDGVSVLGRKILTPDWMTRSILAPVKWFEESNTAKVTAILKQNPS